MASEKSVDKTLVIKSRMPKSRRLIIISFSAIFLLVFIGIITILLYFYCSIRNLNRWEPIYLAKDSPAYQQMKAIVDRINDNNYAWKATINPSIDLVKLTNNQATQFDVDPSKLYPKDHIIWQDPAGYIPMHYIYSNETFVRYSMEMIERLMGLDVDLPDNFDSRAKWPMCASLHTIRNQAGCGSCWAESVTSAMSDRLCVHSNQRIDVQLSTKDLLECCEKCGSCAGGFDDAIAYEHWAKNGLATGGNYHTFEGCKPYPYAPDCGTPCSTDSYPKLDTSSKKCEQQCRPGYGKSYEEAKYFGGDYYFLGITTTIKMAHNLSASGFGQLGLSDAILNLTKPLLKLTAEDFETVLKREIFFNGPFTVTIPVHGELMLYKSGVFHPTSNPGQFVYAHEVKLMGWGVEQLPYPVLIGGKKTTSVPYWTFANTWGRDWGERGFFRVLRDFQLYNYPYNDAVAAIPAKRHRA